MSVCLSVFLLFSLFIFLSIHPPVFPRPYFPKLIPKPFKNWQASKQRRFETSHSRPEANQLVCCPDGCAATANDLPYQTKRVSGRSSAKSRQCDPDETFCHKCCPGANWFCCDVSTSALPLHCCRLPYGGGEAGDAD